MATVRSICAFWILFCLVSTTAFAGQELHVEAGFSDKSGSHALGLVLKTIHSAKQSIHMAAFSFTSKEISKALVSAKDRGVTVMIIADREANTDRYTAVTFLANHNIPIRLNGDFDCMHNKFIVVDKQHVQTGSFNYTKAAASKNAENVMLLWNAPDIAQSYVQEWQKLWDRGQDYPRKH